MPKVANREAAIVAGAKAKFAGTIGGLTDQLLTLREEKRGLQDKIDALEQEAKILEEQLMEKLDKEGTDKGSGKLGTCSISSSIVANVVDWDALNAYIKKTGYFHLYQRRVSDPAARELFESKGKIPGVEPFTKRKLNLRSA